MTIKTIAAVNFALRTISSIEEYYAHLESVLAKARGAEIVVLPEYMLSELLSIVGAYTEREAPCKLLPFAQRYLEYIKSFSAENSCVVVAGTIFQKVGDEIFNVCPIIFPDGKTVFQPKNCLVAYEKEVQGLKGYDGIAKLPLSELGVLVCYDSEFPMATRAHCEQGVKILCVPSSTETIHGFKRVRYSCIARAIENQIFVVHSSLVGSIGKEPHPQSYGSSAIISPAMPEFPNGPVLAESEMNRESVVKMSVDLGTIDSIRQSGEVRNWEDRNYSSWRLDS